MSYNERLADRIRDILGETDGVTEKKMFGGLSFLIYRNMCCGVLDDRIMVRVGPDQYEKALSRKHARSMDFTGRPMKGFVFVDEDGIKTKKQLMTWVQLGVDFTESLPPKK